MTHDSRPATPFSVALTGNIAAGKSTVARWFEQWGARVYDADVLVRELQRAGTPVHRAIVARFSPAVLGPDGELDRSALRRCVLGDAKALADLNAIVHPAVRARRTALEAEAAGRGDRIVVHDIPLLFEAADPRSFDLVVLVDALESVRRERLIHLRGLPAEEADRLMAAQHPSAAKRARSDIVIDNTGDLASLEKRARDAWDRIVAEAARRA